jgi:hypothetical protein
MSPGKSCWQVESREFFRRYSYHKLSEIRTRAQSRSSFFAYRTAPPVDRADRWTTDASSGRSIERLAPMTRLGKTTLITSDRPSLRWRPSPTPPRKRSTAWRTSTRRGRRTTPSSRRARASERTGSRRVPSIDARGIPSPRTTTIGSDGSPVGCQILTRPPPSPPLSRPRRRRRRHQEINERDAWSLEPGGKYFFTRNMSAVCAFAVGGAYAPGSGFIVIGAHTDSPCPKLKPQTKLTSADFLQARSVCCYHTGPHTTALA